MALARSTYYDQAARVVDDTALVEAMCRITDDFEAYGLSAARRGLAASGARGESQEAATPDA